MTPLELYKFEYACVLQPGSPSTSRLPLGVLVPITPSPSTSWLPSACVLVPITASPSPSTSLPPPAVLVTGDDVYRPIMDQQEGFGDSEDDFGVNPGPSVGVSDELAGLNIPTNMASTRPSGSGSQGKRKRGERVGRSNKGKKPASRQIADAVSAIAISSEKRAAMYDAIKHSSITEVMNELLNIKKIANNPTLRKLSYDVMMHQEAREMFLSLKRNPTFVVEWLWGILEKPPKWFQ